MNHTRKKVHYLWYLIVPTLIVMFMFAVMDLAWHFENNADAASEATGASVTVETIPTTELVTEPTIAETEPTEVVETPSEALSAPVSEEKKTDEGLTELEMLAIVIYQEAGGDNYCDECRHRVADVVLNRVASKYYPNTIAEVLTQKSQYGRLHWKGIVWADRAKNKYEKKAVERAWATAQDILDGNHSDVYGKGYVYQAEFKQGKSGFWCCGHYWGKR